MGKFSPAHPMDGTISVDSQPGAGTTFRFSVVTDYEVGDTTLPFPIWALPQAAPEASPS